MKFLTEIPFIASLSASNNYLFWFKIFKELEIFVESIYLNKINIDEKSTRSSTTITQTTHCSAKKNIHKELKLKGYLIIIKIKKKK